MFFRAILGCLALALAVAAPAAVSPARADVSDALKAASRDGHARIVMRMRTGQGGARHWAAADSASRQAASVDAALDDTSATLKAARVENFRRFRTIPYVAADVTREQLMSLASSSAIESITLVQLERHQASAVETQKGATSISSIDVPNAWAMGYDGTGMVVAVIDGGFNLAHPMLAGKAVTEACFTSVYGTSHCTSGTAPQTGTGSASYCPSGSTRCDHASNVASIAVGNDGTNFGVARGAKLLPIDVFSTDTDPTDCAPDATPCEVTDSLAVLDALDYINTRTADLTIAAVNYSGGGGLHDGYCDDDPRKPVIDMLRQKGIAVTIAAANDGVTGKVEAPGCISSAETVGASDDSTNVAGFSNFATMVDLMAPGVNVTAAGGTGSGFLTLSGTSMAAPHVAGAWAIIRQAFPTASADLIDSTLKQTGIALTRTGATFTVPKIQVTQAILKLKGANRGILNNVVSAYAPAGGLSFLRFFNTSAAASTVSINMRDTSSGTLVGTWISPSIAAGASLQIPMQNLEATASPTNGTPNFFGQTSYNMDITSTATGYVQHVLWAQTAGVFANLTSCGNGIAADTTVVPNVHSGAIPNYISRIRVVNTGVLAGQAVLSFSDAGTGAPIYRWTTPVIASGATYEFSMPQLESQQTPLQQAVATGLTQYNVKLDGLSGYLEHVIQNQAAGALVDMTPKCALTVVAAPPATAAASTATAIAKLP